MSTLEIHLTPGPDDLVPVVTYVQAKNVLVFQRKSLEWTAQFDVAALRSDDDYTPEFSSSHGPKDPWQLPEWQPPEDRARARYILRDLRKPQLRIVAKMVAVGEEGMTSKTLREHGGYSDDISVPPIFKAIGGRFRSVDRRPVWDGSDEKGPNGQVLRVRPGPVRDMFADIVKEEWPELAEEMGIS